MRRQRDRDQMKEQMKTPEKELNEMEISTYLIDAYGASMRCRVSKHWL